jgi:hypothetical protein
MRLTNLIRVAAEAEILRIRHLLKRQGMRAALGLAGVVFILGVLVLADIAGWQVLRLYVSAISATLIMLGVNLLIAAMFGLRAARSSPSRTEREALELRRRALQEAQSSLALGTLFPVAGALLRSSRSNVRKRPLWRRLK